MWPESARDVHDIRRDYRGEIAPLPHHVPLSRCSKNRQGKPSKAILLRKLRCASDASDCDQYGARIAHFAIGQRHQHVTGVAGVENVDKSRSVRYVQNNERAEKP
jgi:hypothetical protein